MEWEILNANNFRWGRETYPTQEAAETELKTFWRGVHGVNLKKFTIRQVSPAFAGEPVKHRASPTDRETGQPEVHETITHADVPAGQAGNLQPDAVDRRTIIEPPQQYSLGFGHADSLIPNSRKFLSESGQVLSNMEHCDAAR